MRLDRRVCIQCLKHSDDPAMVAHAERHYDNWLRWQEVVKNHGLETPKACPAWLTPELCPYAFEHLVAEGMKK